jgi:hypothetical protein
VELIRKKSLVRVQAGPLIKLLQKRYFADKGESAGIRLRPFYCNCFLPPDVSSAYLARGSGRHWTARSYEPFGRPSHRVHGEGGCRAHKPPGQRIGAASSLPTTGSEAREIRQGRGTGFGSWVGLWSDIIYLRPPGVRSLVIRLLISRLHHPVRGRVVDRRVYLRAKQYH